jgi:hypothetical protein
VGAKILPGKQNYISQNKFYFCASCMPLLLPGRLVLTIPCARREEPIESAGIEILSAAGLLLFLVRDKK